MATETYSGPVDYAVFVVPRDADITSALRVLLDRVDSGAIEILDLEVIGADPSGEAVRQLFGVLDHGEDFDFDVYEGVESGILDDDDLAAIAAELTGDELAIAVVYEDRGLAVVAEHVATSGGRLLWSGGVGVADLEQALQATEGGH